MIEDNKPCSHPGCLHHITHPCEGCGRIGGIEMNAKAQLEERLTEIIEEFQKKTGVIVACVEVDWISPEPGSTSDKFCKVLNMNFKLK